jgi:hypothetical protein
MRIFLSFQPKLQLRFPLLENTHLSRTILPLQLRILRFRFPKKDQSNFSITTTANIAPQTSIYPVPKAKLPVSDFVLFWPSMPDICVTMLFMVFCCCSGHNKIPVGRNDRFPFTITIVPVCKTAIDLKRGSLYAWSICISSKLFGK